MVEPTLDERLERVVGGLARLAQLDAKRELFGARTHAYRAGAVLTEADVARFEATHGLQLPSEYRAFLRQVGDGAAGPFYGILPLGEDDDGPWTPDGVVGRPGAAFPYDAPWNWPEDRLATMYEGDDEAIEAATAAYWRPLDGAIPLAHEGCALRDWLVVTGPEAGHVWHDATAEYGGYRPWGHGPEAKAAGAMIWRPAMIGSRARWGDASHARRPAPRVSFLAWYEIWLELSLAAASP
jgi:SMI1 / KNR4 family (SUKH-1)